MTHLTADAAPLLIDFTHRLSLEDYPESGRREFEKTGRFAVTESGTLWFGSHSDTPPATARHTYMWALSGNRLCLAPLKPGMGWARNVTLGVIRELTRRIGITYGSLEFCVGSL